MNKDENIIAKPKNWPLLKRYKEYLYTQHSLVIRYPTFQPPVDGARSLASSPVKGFYRR